jgi:hypothetical protein
MKRIGRRLGEIVARYPPRPLTELRDRLAEIIAERPPQGLTWKLSGDLGKIIGVRIAGVPPKQRIEVAQLTIIEILMTGTDVELIGLVRRHVALELARLWTKRGWAKIERQRELMYIETLYSLAKLGRKNKAWVKAGKPLPKGFKGSALEQAAKRSELEKGWNRPALDVVAEFVGKEPESLKKSLQRGRRARKKPQP